MNQTRTPFSSREILRIREELGDSGAWQYHPGADELLLSEAACLMLGIKNSGRSSAHVLFRALGCDTTISFDDFVDALLSGLLNGRSQVVQSKSVPRRVFRLSYNAFYRDDNSVDRLEGLIVEITRQHDALQALNQRRSDARALFEKTGYIEWQAAVDGVIRPSLEWLALTGQPLDEQPENWPESLTPDTRQQAVDAWWAAVDGTSGAFSCSVSAKLLGGETAHFVSSACRLQSDLSGMLGWSGRALRRRADESVAMMLNTPDMIRTLSAPTLRAARALLGWSMHDLATAASVSVSTVRRLEDGETSLRATHTGRIVGALEQAGVSFQVAERGQIAVWVRKS